MPTSIRVVTVDCTVALVVVVLVGGAAFSGFLVWLPAMTLQYNFRIVLLVLGYLVIVAVPVAVLQYFTMPWKWFEAQTSLQFPIHYVYDLSFLTPVQYSGHWWRNHP